MASMPSTNFLFSNKLYGTTLALIRFMPSLSFLVPTPLLTMKPPYPVPVYSGARTKKGKIRVKTPWGSLLVPPDEKARLIWAKPSQEENELFNDGLSLPRLTPYQGDPPRLEDLPLPWLTVEVEDVSRTPRAITLTPGSEGAVQLQLPGFAVSRTPNLPAPVSIIVPQTPEGESLLIPGKTVSVIYLYTKYGRLQPILGRDMTSSNANILVLTSPDAVG